MAQLIDSEYEGTALIADPIHRYMQFTVPEKKGEVTEKALIDSAWVQRLRYIYQLQSARWVFPSAEHSRFQHSLGAMHLAGEFAKHLYPSLRKVLGDECPSAPFIEEYMRVTGLLHDVGLLVLDQFFSAEFDQLHGLREEIELPLYQHEEDLPPALLQALGRVQDRIKVLIPAKVAGVKRHEALQVVFPAKAAALR